jgi:hypothetical protein
MNRHSRSWIPGVLLIALLVGARAPAAAEEIRGISLAHVHRRNAGYGSDECRKQLETIRSIGANWIAISDFAYMRRVSEPAILFDRDDDDGVIRCIGDAHALGLKVLVKPHIWSHEFAGNRKWHGDIRMSSEQDWDAWFAQYGQYLLHHAKIAQEANADMLCVGVEYEGTSASQEQRWRALIAQVRKVYKGPLTYASAYGEWPHIRWWDQMDYIGIDAYFPLAGKPNASEDEIRAGWKHVYGFIEPFARQWNKPILFAEMGYSASAKAAVEPWAYNENDADLALQARLYRIAIEEARKRPYIAGIFFWKWFTSNEFHARDGRDPFAVQDRPLVLDVLRSYWTARN